MAHHFKTVMRARVGVDVAQVGGFGVGSRLGRGRLLLPRHCSFVHGASGISLSTLTRCGRCLGDVVYVGGWPGAAVSVAHVRSAQGSGGARGWRWRICGWGFLRTHRWVLALEAGLTLVLTLVSKDTATVGTRVG